MYLFTQNKKKRKMECCISNGFWLNSSFVMYLFLAAQKLKVFRLLEISKSAKDFPITTLWEVKHWLGIFKHAHRVAMFVHSMLIMLLQMFIHANLGIHYWSAYTFKTFCHKMLIHTDQWNMCDENINTFWNKK